MLIADVDGLHAKRNQIVGGFYLDIIDTNVYIIMMQRLEVIPLSKKNIRT